MIMMHWLGVLLAVLGLGAPATQALPPLERLLSPQKLNCSGWNEPRLFVEAQQWFAKVGRCPYRCLVASDVRGN